MDRVPQPITRMIGQVKRFQEELLGCTLPDVPTRLDAEGKEFFKRAAEEEVQEFMDAETIEDEADALLDLMYFSAGRLVRMGLMPSALFDVVHDANMAKKAGELKKHRSLPGEREAVKPPGWRAPDLVPYLVSREQIEKAAEVMMWGPEVLHHDRALPVGMPGAKTEWSPLPPTRRQPRVLIMGYGRHGKDTVSELLGQHYGLPFQSSSQFCADKVVFPLFVDDEKRIEFIQRCRLRLGVAKTDELQDTLEKYHYGNAVECFERRHEAQALRTLWYEAIRDFNLTDQAALAKGIFAENSIYCGLRSSTEFHAARNEECFDVAVWVDANERLKDEVKEDRSSITVEQWMADFTIDNNGTPEQLQRNVFALFDTLGFKRVV